MEPTKDWTEVLEPATGVAISVQAGQTVRIEQTTGGQVADVICLAAGAIDERLSCSNTIMYNMNLFLKPGSPLYSSRSRVMLRLVEDTVNANNLFLGCCSLESYQFRWDLDYHPSCQEILEHALKEVGLTDFQVPAPLNVFMSWPLHDDGSLEMGSSPAHAGDFVSLVAEMDLIFALSVCPQELTPTNNFQPAPLKLTVSP